MLACVALGCLVNTAPRRGVASLPFSISRGMDFWGSSRAPDISTEMPPEVMAERPVVGSAWLLVLKFNADKVVESSGRLNLRFRKTRHAMELVRVILGTVNAAL